MENIWFIELLRKKAALIPLKRMYQLDWLYNQSNWYIIDMLSALFGSPLREKILLYIAECGEAYSLELTKNFDANLYAVQNQLQRLEEAGILISRTVGRTRQYSMSPRYFMRKELEALLKKNMETLPEEEIRKYYRPRKRPRRAGKPL